MKERRELKSRGNADPQEVNAINREIFKAIGRDIRKHKNEKIIETMEENKSMKVMRRKIVNGKKQIFQLKDKNGNMITDRAIILNILETSYDTLYQSQVSPELTEQPIRRMKNIRSEEIQDISKYEMYYALKKMKNNEAPGKDGVVIIKNSNSF